MRKLSKQNTIGRMLDANLAKQFLKHSDGYDLAFFQTLEPEAGKILATFQGDLFLDGLTNLSPEVANFLIPHRGILSLGGLKKISIPVARALVKRKSPFSLRNSQETGDGLLLSNRVIQILLHEESKIDGISINPCRLDDKTCEALAKFKGCINLSNYLVNSKFQISQQGLRALSSLEKFHANAANLNEETLRYFKQHYTLDCDEIWEKKHKTQNVNINCKKKCLDAMEQDNCELDSFSAS